MTATILDEDSMVSIPVTICLKRGGWIDLQVNTRSVVRVRGRNKTFNFNPHSINKVRTTDFKMHIQLELDLND